jgi:hypothetical protein
LSALQQRITRISSRLRGAWSRRQNDAALKAMAQLVASRARPQKSQTPVVLFNASTRLSGLSLNAAFSLLTAWGLRLRGIPVIHFVCQQGMSRCVLGTNRDDVSQTPPCEQCIAHSRMEYFGADVRWFGYTRDEKLARIIQGMSLTELEQLVFNDLPLGKLVMPALRWELRRHHLVEDDATRFLYREFILSAWNVAVNFSKVLDEVKPQVVLVFNGQFFPEATARYLARQRGIRTVAHEVGLMPFTAFFTEGEATAYPIDIPDGCKLTQAQNEKLDAYLQKRFQGNFKMAGIQFWHGMRPLDPELLQKMAKFRWTVPVFTNVIFDTSQPHSNVIFPDMFTWLNEVLTLAKRHPQVLFIIRAHPDELRPGSAKQSRETVRDWVKSSGALDLPNIHYIDPLEYVSSYELIQRSKFTMVYNSSIGLEAAIMGAAVLSAGRSRYTAYPTVFFPPDRAAYQQKVEEMLFAEEIRVPIEFVRMSRLFLYYQLFKTGLPFSEYLQESSRPGLVKIKNFKVDQLLPDRSVSLGVIWRGLIENGSFYLEDE